MARGLKAPKCQVCSREMSPHCAPWSCGWLVCSDEACRATYSPRNDRWIGGRSTSA